MDKFLNMSDEELDEIIFNEGAVDMVTLYNACAEKHLRRLGDNRDLAVDMASMFGLSMHGYMNYDMPHLGYLVTDRRITKTTFTVDELSHFSFASSYVKKIKDFYPKNWMDVVKTIADNLQSPYKDFMLGYIDGDVNAS